jgi:luciferase family oxidoreductase group 1
MQMDQVDGGFIQSCMSLPVSVLDLVGMRTGESAGSAIARSVDLAQHIEGWGYRRYWMAEHHSIAGLACSATSVLIGHVAASTKTIRVGSGGVMLPNHAPLVVAEQFGTLEALYPGRIDLGLGRAPGGDFHTMRALRRDLQQSGDDFPDLLEELRTYLGPEKPGQVVKAIPGQGSLVPITLLGSSDFSARLAAELGLPFAFASHFAPDLLFEAARLYRTHFRPSEVLEQPWLMVGVPVIAADSDAAAHRLFTTAQQRFLRLIRNQPVELLPPVESMDGRWTEDKTGTTGSRYRSRRGHCGDGHLRSCGPAGVVPTSCRDRRHYPTEQPLGGDCFG